MSDSLYSQKDFLVIKNMKENKLSGRWDREMMKLNIPSNRSLSNHHLNVKTETSRTKRTVEVDLSQVINAISNNPEIASSSIPSDEEENKSVDQVEESESLLEPVGLEHSAGTGGKKVSQIILSFGKHQKSAQDSVIEIKYTKSNHKHNASKAVPLMRTHKLVK
jgi:hypothetical protein